MKFIAAFIVFVLSVVSAFRPIARYSTKRISASKLLMGNSDFERSMPPPKPPAEEPEANKAEQEAPPEPRKEISDDMRARLRQELISQGADPNYSAGPILGNPILIISGIIAILVIVGGKGYFF